MWSFLPVFFFSLNIDGRNGNVGLGSTVVEERTGFLFSGITTHKVVTKVTDFHWKAGTEWELKLYAGSIANQQQLQLMGRSKIIDVITPTDVAPGAAPQVNFRSHESKNV